ncbi:MAG TPA: hypothetical protein ENI95_05160 [Chloroflexi bacterium]|nr:hypothetical protein [Chloroflexota bacterium]
MDITAIQDISLGNVLLVLAVCAGAALVGAIGLLVAAAQQVARIEIPEDADFFETLQLVPITVPLALDLLDMAFDIFSAPISWIILELLGLQALQLITVFEGLLPGTQLIPTMTAAWLLARAMRNRRRQSPLRGVLSDYQQMERQARLGELRRRSVSLADSYRRQPLLPPDNIVDGEIYEEEEFEDDFDMLPPGGPEDEEW